MATGDLITRDYQIEFNGLLMGAETPYDVVAVIGAGFPAVRSLDINKQGDHGTYATRRELMSSRIINIEIDVIATDIQDLHSKVNILKRALSVSDVIRPVAFRFAATGWGETYGEDVFSLAYVRQLTGNIGDAANYNTQKVYIQFECPDPRVYAETEHVATTGPGSIVGGWTFPWTFPWTFATIVPSTIVAVNDGIIDTPLTVKFNGPVLNPKITNQNTGEFMEIDIQVNSSEFLLLSFRDKTALLNGTANRYNNRRAGSTWFPLRPGTTPLQYSLASGTGLMEVRWRDAYI